MGLLGGVCFERKVTKKQHTANITDIVGNAIDFLWQPYYHGRISTSHLGVPAQ